MSDEQDKPTLTRKPLGLKRTVEAGQVQQQFSHGRRNTVVVEVKRRRVLGRPDIVSDRNLLPKLPQSPDGFLSDVGNKAVRAELVKAFAADSATAWEQKLAAAGVPASKVQTVPSYLDGHYLQTGRADSELAAHPLGREGPAHILHEGFRWVGETHAQPGPPPRLGEHTREVLDELQQKKSAASA